MLVYLAHVIQKSLAASLLRTFSRREQTAFDQFLQRPDRSVRPDVRRLFDALPGMDDTAERAEAERAVYGKEKVDHRRINQLLSWLYAEACDFLLERCRREDTPLPLLAEFDRRGLPLHRDRLLRKLQRREGDYRQRYELAWAAQLYGEPISRTRPTNFQEISDLVDLDFTLSKLRVACLMRSHENVYPAAYDYGLLETLLLRLSPENLAAHPVISVYFHAYQFMTDAEDHTAFRHFQELLQRHRMVFSDTELRDLYLIGINHCIRLANLGDATRSREALDLYRAGIDSGILLENNQITPYTYRNAVALSLKIRDFEWAENFIHRAADLLPATQRDNLLHYNLASLAYHRGQRDKALEELRFVRSRDTLFTLTIDTLRAKVYHENGDFELLASHLDKMKIFLLRKDSSYHHRNYANFVRFLRKIGRRGAGSEMSDELLRQHIRGEAVLTERRWLLDRLAT